ncbi:hypothetical protein [Dyella sp. 20L07]|uniref:hypothetical protein n=1 Tax=Dyella sp. 20L07 TaxID=3384240 RepID=UPI003D2E2E6A
MKVAIGFKAHSGWAAMVALGLQEEHLQLADRRQVPLVDACDAGWSRQPYHAAEGMIPARAQALVQQGIEAARRVAVENIALLLQQLQDAGHDIAGAAVLTGSPMPAWSTQEILAVHIRMHQAEGHLFPDALAAAIAGCGLPLGLIPERELDQLAPSVCPWKTEIAALGKWAGPPWGVDQKHAAMAAMVMFGSRLH